MVPTMEEAFKCDLCSDNFDSYRKLNVHSERQHVGIGASKYKKFQCNMCGYECHKGKDLIKHMRRHTGERPFKCQVSTCGREFKQESALKTHIQCKHIDDRPFACPRSGCHFRTNIKCELPRNIANVHSESKTLTCPKCDYNTTNASNLARHMVVHEGNNQNIPCSIDGCEYKGKHSEAFKRHMWRHKTLLPCSVSGCGRYLTTKEALKNHLKLHNPSGRAFKCPLCFKHFPRLLDLRKHCVVHTNEKPFQCGHCKYEAATRRQVKGHISSAHPSIEFPFVFHLLDERECLRCKVTLPSAEFVAHLKGHVEPVLET